MCLLVEELQNAFSLDLKAASQGEIHAWYYKSVYELMAGELGGRRSKYYHSAKWI